MLRIEHSETPHVVGDSDPRSATKRYADALWQANPRISPDWWREAHGHTLGKVALDARDEGKVAEALAAGCNLVVATPQSWPSFHAEVSLLPEAAACISLLLVPDATLPEVLPTCAVWSPSSLPDAAVRGQVLQGLEQAVQGGRIEAYGLHLHQATLQPLHVWLQEAAAAAHAAWGRKKRPALRWLVVEQDLFNLAHVTHPTTLHHDEAVSTLELASRLGLAVVVLPQVLPSSPEPPAAALAALTAAAEAEAILHQSLGGWPQVQGQALFSLLAALGQGQAPWPDPYVWQAWQVQVWPHLQTIWRQVAEQGPAAEVEAYLAACRNLVPHGASLALAAAQPLLADMLDQLEQGLPAATQGQAPLGRLLTVLTALPAVTAVAVPVLPPLAPLREAPGVPDVAAVLACIR